MTRKFERIVELKIRSFFFLFSLFKSSSLKGIPIPDPLIEFLSKVEFRVNYALKP